MSGKSHTKGMLIKPNFCTQRKKGNCTPCGNNYTSVVTASDYKFPRLVKQGGVPTTIDISQNAHHILCVAEVTGVISKDKKLKKILQNTQWCINKSKNMISLPLFYHTVNWYCKDRSRQHGRRETIGGVLTSLKIPKFVNLPNHDFDHGEYNKDVRTALEKLNGTIKQAVHKYDSGEVAGELDDLCDDFRSELVDVRGKRQGGTHVAWMAALQGKCDKWYEPFSLASGGGVTRKAFPGKVRKLGDELADVLDNLMKAILNR